MKRRRTARRGFLLGVGTAGAGAMAGMLPVQAAAAASETAPLDTRHIEHVLAGTVTYVSPSAISITARDGTVQMIATVLRDGQQLRVGEDAVVMRVEGRVVASPLYQRIAGVISSIGPDSVTIGGTSYATSGPSVLRDRHRNGLTAERATGRQGLALLRTNHEGDHPLVDRVFVS